MNQPSAEQEMPKVLASCLRVGARLQAGRQDDHIHRDAALLADQGIFHLDDQLALFARVAGRVGDFGHLAAYEQGAFLDDALVELVVALGRGADIDVEVVDGRAGLFVDQMGELEALHTANGRAVVVVVLVTRCPRSG